MATHRAQSACQDQIRTPWVVSCPGAGETYAATGCSSLGSLREPMIQRNFISVLNKKFGSARLLQRA